MEGRLREIGFTPGEEKVYLALLALGSSTSGSIAKHSGVSRSKLYEIMERLSKKGLVSHVKRNKILYFSAAHPRIILDHIRKKEETLRYQRLSFEKNLPLFENLMDEKKSNDEVEFFEGNEGIKNVCEAFLRKSKPGDSFYEFGNSSSGYTDMLGYWDDFSKRRARKKVHALQIFNLDAKPFGERRKELSCTQIKYLPKAGPTHSRVVICGNSSVSITTRHKTPMTIVINNKLVAESFKTYFDVLWDASTE
jgi:sugar-specific transcriptional regulator TrmB